MANSSSIRSKTDTKGRYISQGLQPGVYRVSLVVNGAVKAAIGNTKTKSDQATQLNFDLKPVAAGQASTEQKKGKHMVWMPPSTGSHTGGRWVEVPDGAAEAGALNVKRASAEQLQREAHSMGQSERGAINFADARQPQRNADLSLPLASPQITLSPIRAKAQRS